MTEVPPYPPIDPTSYDLVVIGTGLQESVIAAAASAAGKSVLHLDANPFYGSHFSSLSLPELGPFLNSLSTPPAPTSLAPSLEGHDLVPVDLTIRPLYSSVEISSFAPEVLEKHSRKFNVDVSGPRVLFCADRSIDWMLKSGASQYVEFKSIDASFLGDHTGDLKTVPDSRAAIFKDKTMSLTEKNQLMKFFKLVQEHLAASGEDEYSGGEDSPKIAEEHLESPFVDFLAKMRLPPKIKSIILYAIAMADYDQEKAEDCKDVMRTKDGIGRLALYSSSVGRFQNALGALIYPIYGQGELPQAFCRRAAVKGCLYVLRMPVNSLLLDKETGTYKGVRLASGQDILSQKLVLDPCYTISSLSMSTLSDTMRNTLNVFSTNNTGGKVARGICITRHSLKPDSSNVLVVYPPRSLFPEQGTAVRVLQIGGGLAVCPADMYVLYLSALCGDADEGKRLLTAAMEALITTTSSDRESEPEGESDVTEGKPTLWRALYVQELIPGQFGNGNISSTSMPDGNLNYNGTLEEAFMLFQRIFPDEEFFPGDAVQENAEDESGHSLDD